MAQSPPRVVAVLDSDPDTIEMLKTMLEYHGLVAATGSLIDFRLGKADLLEFLQRTAPDVIVYDLGLPYETNYQYLRKVREASGFPKCPLVITTTNARVVRDLLGIEALEIVGKPYDMAALLEAVWADGPNEQLKSVTHADGDGGGAWRNESSKSVTHSDGGGRQSERRAEDRRAGNDRRGREDSSSGPVH
jgi:CheY-like chemotaxis protein